MGTPKKKPNDAFTTDGDTYGGGEIPSVTKLLDRKSLSQVIKKAPKEQPVASEEPSSPAPAEPVQTARPAVKRQQKNTAASASNTPLLQVWQPAQLQASQDPLGKALHYLLHHGASEALFMPVHTPAPGSQVPTFKAKGAFAGAPKIALWAGMIWDPQTLPEIWNAIVKVGWVELSPPDSNTNLKSKRNVIRGAFGAQTQEWVTLARIGPLNQCRGILAIISTESMIPALQSQASLLSAVTG